MKNTYTALYRLLPWIVIGGVFLLYSFRLTLFPIFADEAIYLFWARRIHLGEVSPFIPLFDGKPPLFVWLSALGGFFTDNLLLVGRLVSVLSFVAVLTLIWRVTAGFNRIWAWTALLFISFSPFLFFHSRLAIMDPGESLFLLAAVFAWLTIKTSWRGVVTGLLLGLGFWMKTPALFVFPFPVLAALFFERNKRTFIQALLATFTAASMVAVFRVSVWFPFLFNRTQDFSYGVSELLEGNLSHVPGNLKNLFTWFFDYRQLPMLILTAGSFILGVKKGDKTVLTLVLAALLFTLPFIVFGKVLSPRYYLFLGLLLPLLAAYSMSYIVKLGRVFMGLLVILVALPFFWLTWTNPLALTLPAIDSEQYLEAWSSGIGINEAGRFFLEEAENKEVTVLTEGYFGTLPDALFVLLGDQLSHTNLEILGVGTADSDNSKKAVSERANRTIYYIGNRDRIDNDYRQTMELVLTVNKANGGPPLDVYRIYH